MRAVAVDAFGETPRLMDLPEPTPGDDEIRVRIRAAAINPFDAKIANGLLRPRPHLFPLVLGVDGAGVVDAAGPKVRRFRTGDAVFGSFLHDPVGTGTYAEVTVVPEGNALQPQPSSLSAVQAAALPTAGMTAVDSLDRLDLRAGDHLLVIGASGGVGSFGVLLAARRGVTVLAAARPGSFDRLRTLGAAETWDVTLPEWSEAFHRAHPDGVAALLDLMSPAEELDRRLALVGDGGRAATTVYASGSLEPRRGIHAFDIRMEPTADLLGRLASEVSATGALIPVTRTVSLSEAPAVLADIRSGRGGGKAVIRVDERSGA